VATWVRTAKAVRYHTFCPGQHEACRQSCNAKGECHITESQAACSQLWCQGEICAPVLSARLAPPCTQGRLARALDACANSECCAHQSSMCLSSTANRLTSAELAAHCAGRGRAAEGGGHQLRHAAPPDVRALQDRQHGRLHRPPGTLRNNVFASTAACHTYCHTIAMGSAWQHIRSC